jgi:hypothetical protein
MELKISKAQGELKNVNLRTEFNGDERVLSVDLKVKANISATEAAPLFQDTPGLIATLFDEGGTVLNPVIQFLYRVQIENIELKIDKQIFKGGKIKKNIALIPRNGHRFEMMFTAQLGDVGDVRPLADMLNEEVIIHIIERQAKLDLEAAA